jgi:hypothetical protein
MEVVSPSISNFLFRMAMDSFTVLAEALIKQRKENSEKRQ